MQNTKLFSIASELKSKNSKVKKGLSINQSLSGLPSEFLLFSYAIAMDGWDL
jgi:hypothetical protein